MRHIDRIGIVCDANDWSGFKNLESEILSPNKNRIGPSVLNILDAENLIYYHAIFVHNLEREVWLDDAKTIPLLVDGSILRVDDSISGCADPPNRHLVVSLGSFKKSLNVTATGDVRSNPEYEGGTLLHELGHTLGLHHGGGDEYAYKPNYLSVMSYNLQFPDLVGMRALDFSRCEMPPLNESGLNESAGTGQSCPNGLQTFIGYKEKEICPPGKIYPSGVPLDWNMNRVNESLSNSTHDIDCNSNLTVMNGHDDWSNLHYLLNGSTWENLKFSGLGGAQERLTDGFAGERRAESVIDHRILLLSQTNDTAAEIASPAVQEIFSGAIGLSNNTTPTDIIIPNNASGSLVVNNASGSFAVQNAISVTVPTNLSTTFVVNNASGSFAVQTGANGTIPDNITEALLPVKSNTSTSSNIIVDNATDAIISNGTGVIATNATGSFLIENATDIIIPSNNTNGATVQNGTSLSDLIVKSNNLLEAINKIDELNQVSDSLSGFSYSTLGGVSTGDPIINSTTHGKMTSQLENLKLVLEKQLGS